MGRRMALAAISAVLLSACSTVQTTIIPMRDGQYQAIATAESFSDAQQGAIDKSAAVCKKQGKHLSVISNKTVYQGSGKELGAVTSLVNDITFVVPSTKSDTDYKTIVAFTCE